MPRRAAPLRPSLALPTETWLLWGLLYDLSCAPFWLVQALRGRARWADGLRPWSRLLCFATAARMSAVLILLNLAGFAWEVHARSHGLSTAAFLHRFATSPADLRAGRYLPLLTHLFAHAGPAHLFANMVPLLVFGRVVERQLGPLRLLGAYLGAGAVSTALSLGAQAALGHSVPTLGASGAVAGLVALGILFSPFTLTFEALVPMPLCVLGWLAMAADFSGLSTGRRDGIDHFAHLGGYLSVLLIYAGLGPEERRLARTGLLLNLATAGLLLLFYFLWLDTRTGLL